MMLPCLLAQKINWRPGDATVVLVSQYDLKYFRRAQNEKQMIQDMYV